MQRPPPWKLLHHPVSDKDLVLSNPRDVLQPKTIQCLRRGMVRARRSRTSPHTMITSSKRKASTPLLSPPLSGSEKRHALPPLYPTPTVEYIGSTFQEGSEREDWLIERLLDPAIYIPLQSGRQRRRRGRYAPTQNQIYRQLAQEFNGQKFSTPSGTSYFTTPVSGTGVMTKIRRMGQIFRHAHALAELGSPSTKESAAWREAIEAQCRYYFRLREVWGKTWTNGSIDAADFESKSSLKHLLDEPATDEDEGDHEYNDDDDDNDDEPNSGTLHDEAEEPLMNGRRRSVRLLKQGRPSYADREPSVSIILPRTTSHSTCDHQEQSRDVGNSSSRFDRVEAVSKSRSKTNASHHDLRAARVQVELQERRPTHEERSRTDTECGNIERELYLKEKDLALKEREIVLKEREIALKEREMALKEREIMLKERNRKLTGHVSEE